jgi:hypothetical protein
MDMHWPFPQNMPERMLEQTLFGKRTQSRKCKMPDFECIHRELARSGVTLSLLWNEYCENCRMEGSRPLMYTQFCYYYQQFAAQNKATLHLEHKPGEGMEVDWAGDTTFAGELPFLIPLPSKPFELSSWKTAAVQLNYHIAAGKMNYSVPYEYIKYKVDVRLTQSVVEIFYQGTRIASHKRLYGHPGQYSTVPEHMSEKHRQYTSETSFPSDSYSTGRLEAAREKSLSYSSSSPGLHPVASRPPLWQKYF